MVSIRLPCRLLIVVFQVVSVRSQSTTQSWGVGGLRVGRDVVAQHTNCPSEYYTFYKTPAGDTRLWCKMLCCQCRQRTSVPEFLWEMISYCRVWPDAIDDCIGVCTHGLTEGIVNSFRPWQNPVTHPPTYTTLAPPVVPTTELHASTIQSNVSLCPIECAGFGECTDWMCQLNRAAKVQWVGSAAIDHLEDLMDQVAACALSNCLKTITHKTGPLGTAEAQKLKGECGLSTRLRPHRHFKWVGGSLAQPGEHPWAVLIFRIIPELQRQNFPSSCSGTLISQRHVLTALHCIKKIRDSDGNLTLHKIACSGPLNPGKFESYRIHYGTTSWSESMTHPSTNQTLSAEARLGVAYQYHTPCANGRAAADMAILEFLPEAPPPDDMQRPICLPDKTPQSQVLQHSLRGFGFGRAIHPDVEDDNRGTEDWNRWLQQFSLTMQPSTACGGDSGAGVTQMVDGREQVVGVVVSTLNTNGTDCRHVQAAVRSQPADTEGTQAINVAEFVDFFCDKAGICP